MPIVPPLPGYVFDVADDADDLVGIGADLTPGALLEAYVAGVFPMGIGADGGPPVGWWSPEPRGVLPLDGLRVSRSLRQACRRYDVTFDQDVPAVIEGCADPQREGRWITPEVTEAYLQLAQLGWVHSVEVWDARGLAGGLYGVAVGGLFAGESMFHRRRDASKVALVALVDRLRSDGDQRRLLDVQWSTPHLARLGAVEIPRAAYLQRLETAVQAPLPPGW